MNANDDQDRFSDWQSPEIEEGVLTKYNWLVQHVQNFQLYIKIRVTENYFYYCNH